jgi:hypothetical protein
MGDLRCQFSVHELVRIATLTRTWPTEVPALGFADLATARAAVLSPTTTASARPTTLSG